MSSSHNRRKKELRERPAPPLPGVLKEAIHYAERHVAAHPELVDAAHLVGGTRRDALMAVAQQWLNTNANTPKLVYKRRQRA